MIESRTAPYGALLLRVALGAMFLAHSLYLKVVVFTVPGTVNFFQSLGLPAIAAYGTIAVEATAGVLLILGFRARWAALATLPVLLGATWVHAHNGWVFNANGGGWEYPVFLAVAATVQALLGDGAWSVDGSSRRAVLASSSCKISANTTTSSSGRAVQGASWRTG